MRGVAVHRIRASAAEGRHERTGVPPRRLAAVAGVVAGAVAIGASELLAGVVPGIPSLLTSVGELVIALQPAGAKDLVVSLFGANDKLALDLMVLAAAVLAAMLAGIAASRSEAAGASVFVAFGVVAFVAAAVRPLGAPGPAAVTATGSAVLGIAVLRYLLGLAAWAPRLRGQRPAAVARLAMPDWSRRRFLLASGGLLGGAVVAGTVGRALVDRQHPAGAPANARLPIPADAVPALSPDQSLDAAGLTPIIVPNDRFYRIDTELLIPQVDAASWQLRISGMVDHPVTLSYDELLAMPVFEQYVTIACVSNEVGGHLVGNALWTGVRLKALLAAAGVQAGATQIVGRSVDGFTVGFPTEWALAADREPMVAVGMNRAPLPAEHGYPARLIVPGLYGYVSATKWLSEIELTTREAFDAYWIRLGWAKDGPILTQSRIDRPAGGSSIAAGPVEVGGVAWAPDRGVQRVEVRIDGGSWQEAMLSRAISKATWVQWMLRWNADPGTHTIEARAIDGTGAPQSPTPGGPAPAGATGYPTIEIAAR